MRIRKIYYTSKFVRNFRCLSRNLQKKAAEKESVFRENPFHPSLKTHKLKGVLRNFYSFSVGYKYRIVFVFENGNEATFVDIGDHSIYR